MDGTPRTPRYAEILAELREGIAGGAFPVGTLLPSEAALCRRFAVSRFTVREALRRLEADGMLARVRGAGSRVIRDAPVAAFVQHYRSLSDLADYAGRTRLDVQSVSEVVLDAPLAAQVGGTAGTRWLALRALRRAEGGEVIAVVESFLPARFAAIIPRVDSISGPLYAALAADSGETIENAIQETQALAAPHHVAVALGVRTGAPLLRILRRYAARSGVLIASFNWHHGGDRYVHRASLNLGGG